MKSTLPILVFLQAKNVMHALQKTEDFDTIFKGVYLRVIKKQDHIFNTFLEKKFNYVYFVAR